MDRPGICLDSLGTPEELLGPSQGGGKNLRNCCENAPFNFYLSLVLSVNPVALAGVVCGSQVTGAGRRMPGGGRGRGFSGALGGSPKGGNEGGLCICSPHRPSPTGSCFGASDFWAGRFLGNRPICRSRPYLGSQGGKVNYQGTRGFPGRLSVFGPGAPGVGAHT